jgi:hypothetical protein
MSTTSPVSSPPQLVFLTFDDAITSSNYNNYTYILGNRVNPNNCSISMTFYVTHKSNDYSYTHDLYYKGNEIAVKSVSDKTPSDLWANMTTPEAVDEIGGVRDMVSTYANIPKSSIKGWRAPYLQTSGDWSMAALKSVGLSYEHTYTTMTYTNPSLFPYTLDNGFTQDCQSNVCPMQSFAGLWNVPMVALTDSVGTKCAMADACRRPTNETDMFNFLKSNFDIVHNSASKAPFGVYLRSALFQGWPYTLTGYKMFLDYIQTFSDVYIVSVSKGIDWMKNPMPLSQVAGSTVFACPKTTPSTCNPRKCYYNDQDGNDVVMSSCVVCPNNYPWV